VIEAKEQINNEATDNNEEVKEIDKSDDEVENDDQDIKIVPATQKSLCSKKIGCKNGQK
jgi:hypothetical protein